MEDFISGLTPFEFVYSFRQNPFQHERMQKIMSDYAKKIGFIGFSKQYKAYCKSMSMEAGQCQSDNPTNFTGQTLELNAGEWMADDSGVSREGFYGTEYACMHPIMPVERLVNIDTGEEKMRLAYRKGKVWRTTVVDKRVLASANKITELASAGVLVTSENAKLLVRYLSDLDALNYEAIPERKSVGRLGYIQDEGFSPYVEGLIFDGDASFRSLFLAVEAHGSYEEWKKTALRCREMSLTARILLAASFASPLLEVLGALPFFVHLWGVDSGTGKTVALMLAASVWGNPALGSYLKTFDSTIVGNEKTAAFLNHLPLCLDELQLARDSKGRTQFDVYKLAQGVGRTRGNKSGGVDMTPTWKNTILTTGESPLIGQNAGAGAVNRVIDIECVSGSPVITEGREVSAAVKSNYGFAGREFVERLYSSEEERSGLMEMYNTFFGILSQSDTTEKQAMAAAAILTADTAMCDWIFKRQCMPMSFEDIKKFLASKASVSLGERFYPVIVAWVAENRSHFETIQMPAQNGTYGRIEGDIAYISKVRFDALCEENGVSSRSVLSWMKEKGLIRTQNKGCACRKRVDGIPIQTIAVHIDFVREYADEDEIL